MVARGRPGALRPDALTIQVRTLDTLACRQLDVGGPWRVQSVFARACNLMAPDGELLGIVAADAGNAPATLRLEPLTPHWPLDHLIVPGLPASIHDGRLAIGSTLTLDLAGAQLWQPAVIRRSLEAPEIGLRIAEAASIGSRRAPAGGLVAMLPGRPASSADPVVEQARTLLPGLLAAIRAEQWSDAAVAARSLSGLGPGLTPAGDDLLTGLALGLRAAHGKLPVGLSEAITGAVVGRTTDLAAARVRHAVAGSPDEYTHAVLAALVMDQSAASLPGAVRALLEYGHSSGADTLVGLLEGVGDWVNCQSRPPSPEP